MPDLDSVLVDRFVCLERVRWLPVDPAQGLPDRRLLERVVEAGAGVSIYTRSDAIQEVSLSFLEPVIEQITCLSLHGTARITNARILERAVSLSQLAVGARLDAVVALDQLPRLTVFEGILTRNVASVARNPALERIRVEGTIPKSVRSFPGPMKLFWHESGRSATELPTFEQPSMLEHIEREGPRSFDLTALEPFTNLATFRITRCDELTHLEVIDKMPKLHNVQILGCYSPDGWDLITRPERVLLVEVRPAPSARFVKAGLERGWGLEQASPMLRGLWVERSDDDSGWGVFQDDFAMLNEAARRARGFAASGHEAEVIILAAVRELQFEGHDITAEPDSESDFAAVYFATQKEATLVADRARQIQSEGIDVLVGHLKRGPR